VKDIQRKTNTQMLIKFLKNHLLNLTIVFLIFLTDRISKFYVLQLADQMDTIDIYLTKYLNIYLIWNKGIAFGLMSFNSNIIYNFITFLIITISIAVFIMVIRHDGFKKYSLTMVLGGALGNLFDRVYYGAVPDFIDIHFKSFHWFIFNIADIFITLGVFCLIWIELFNKNRENEK
tara:strand:- start:393 stop:920 length:528 start_codon:yes stop_codon:yes gene_type:complete